MMFRRRKPLPDMTVFQEIIATMQLLTVGLDRLGPKLDRVAESLEKEQERYSPKPNSVGH